MLLLQGGPARPVDNENTNLEQIATKSTKKHERTKCIRSRNSAGVFVCYCAFLWPFRESDLMISFIDITVAQEQGDETCATYDRDCGTQALRLS